MGCCLRKIICLNFFINNMPPKVKISPVFPEKFP